MSINVMKIREVYEDNDEIASWCDRSTYEGAEIYIHLIGLYDTALHAADEIEQLSAENERLREALTKIALHYDRIYYPGELSFEFAEIARAALKG